MDAPMIETDLSMIRSRFADLVVLIIANVRKFENDVQQYEAEYSKKMKDIKLRNQKYFPRTNIQQMNLDKHIELWMKDFKDNHKKFEFSARAGGLKEFFHESNYLHIFRPSITKFADHQFRLPVYNITFPKSEENEIPRIMHKPRKCRGVTKDNTCKPRQ